MALHVSVVFGLMQPSKILLCIYISKAERLCLVNTYYKLLMRYAVVTLAFLMGFHPDWCDRDDTGMIGTVIGMKAPENCRSESRVVSLLDGSLKPQSHRIVRFCDRTIGSATTDRQCLLRSPFTIARSGVFFTIGCRSYVTLHDNILFIPSGQL